MTWYELQALEKEMKDNFPNKSTVQHVIGVKGLVSHLTTQFYWQNP